MFSEFRASAAGFDADQLHGCILDERMKHPDRVAAAAHAGNHCIGQAALRLENLLARLKPDHAMKIAHHGRIRMSAQRGAEQIVGCGNIGDPVAHGLADGVLQRAAARS